MHFCSTDGPMMNLAYLVPRVFRHFMPESLIRFLLLRSLIINLD
jgi:hypothetical protein